MVTSIRLNEELEVLLENASREVGQTKSEVIRAAIEKYCQEIMCQSNLSLWDKMIQAGFRPIASDSLDTDLSSNKEKQRRIILEGSYAILVDTGPLVAVLDIKDVNHQRCKQVLKELPTRTTTLTVTSALVECCHYLSSKNIPSNHLFSTLNALSIHLGTLETKELERVSKLMDKYHDLPMDFADAEIVVLAEKLNIKTIFTLDKDFTIYKPAHISRFEILPRLN